MTANLKSQISEAPVSWRNNSWMIEATLRQVEKDFRLQAVRLELDETSDSYLELVELLATKLDEMDFVHHSRFVPILYQIDLPQKKVAQRMASARPQNIYYTLADLILKRCFEKIYWRQRMKEENP